MNGFYWTPPFFKDTELLKQANVDICRVEKTQYGRSKFADTGAAFRFCFSSFILACPPLEFDSIRAFKPLSQVQELARVHCFLLGEVWVQYGLGLWAI